MAGGFYTLTKSGTIFRGHRDRALEIAQETESIKRDIIAPLERLDNVNIDTGFFDEKEYGALKDITVTLPPPVLERIDPFAPVN